MKNSLFVPLALLAAGFVLLAQPAKAQDYSNIRIVRLSFVEGTVQYQRPGQDWQDASLNLPIQQGFSLRTVGGYAEVEFEDSLAMHLGTESTVEFTVLALQDGGRITRLTVSQGTAIVSAKLARWDSVSVATPKLTMTVPRNGRFRVDVSPVENWVTVFHGKVEVDSDSGTSTLLSGGHTLHEDANGQGSPEIAKNPPQDAFDKWVSHREDAVNAARSETSDVLGTSSYTEGFADLYDYGMWSYIPGYGLGWMPYGLGAGWMPFVNGQWQFMGGTGWNWVSGEPWGWLPYHFGSWVNAPGIGWTWLPPASASAWMPATARWVQVNNQLGWIPNGPPQTSKPTKTSRSAAPATVILAAQGASSTIRAGARVPLAQAGMNVRAASAPTPRFIASAPSTHAVARTNEAARANTFVQSAPAFFARGAGAPPSLRAPSARTAQLAVARLSAVPRAVMAPHSMPAPAIARGASAGGFRGGFGGARGGGGGSVGMGMMGARAGASASAHGSTAGGHR